MMSTIRNLTAGLAVAVLVPGAFALAQTPASERDLIESAAEALGGLDRLLAARSLQIEGHGKVRHQNGGGSVTAALEAPEKWLNITGVRQTIDLENDRMRLRQQRFNDFVFAYARNMTEGIAVHQVVDGHIGYTVSADDSAQRVADMTARQWRMEMLANPVSALRAALREETSLGNLRRVGGDWLVDMSMGGDDRMTLAVDQGSGLPVWVSWVGPDANLGEVTYRTHFTGYQPWQRDGLLLPTGYRTEIDFRDVISHQLYVDRTAIDVAFDDMSAPQSVREAPASPQRPSPQAEEVAEGVWLITSPVQGHNSIAFEFDDHIKLYEVPSNETWTLEIIETARGLVPGKPVTHAIVSHHHFDHSGGLRAAVAEGLTIITHRGNIELFEELVARPTRVFPDALGSNPQPLQTVAVDDHLQISDESMTIDIYRVVANNHMADAVMVHVPRDQLLVQADIFDMRWDVMWWGNNYMDNINHRGIEVAYDVPVHGAVLSLEEVNAHIEEQIANAAQVCERVASVGMSLQGCPLSQTGEAMIEAQGDAR